MMTQARLFALVKALPHMTITKTEWGEYRVVYTLPAIKAAYPNWSKERLEARQEATSYETEDREDALGTAKSLSEHWVALMMRRGQNVA